MPILDTDAAQPTERARRRGAYLTRGEKLIALAVGGVATSVLATGVAYAAINAVATGSMSASSGTLSLTMANNGVGFSSGVSNLAPGDVVNRYVTLTNGGTLDASGLTLAVSGTGGTLLTTDATKGLAVSVTSCTVAWTPATGVCSSSSTTVLLASTPVATLTGTPGTLVSGAVTAGTVRYLKVSTTLPDQNETTTNGSFPSNTIQGLSTTLTYTFGEVQRAAQTTNS
jgi:hypothetical protein